MGETVALPDVPEPVKPDPAQEVVLALLQLRADDWPDVIDAGEAVRVRVGGVALALFTFTERTTDVHVPPACPGGTENAATMIEVVPLARWVVSTGSVYAPPDGATSGLIGLFAA